MIPGGLHAIFRVSVSHIEKPGRLLVVGTPIGNLEDLSPRGRRALAESDVIFCEDTRVTAKLAARFGIAARRISCPAPREAGPRRGAARPARPRRDRRARLRCGNAGAVGPGRASRRRRRRRRIRRRGRSRPLRPGRGAGRLGPARRSRTCSWAFCRPGEGERRRFLEAIAGRTETLVWFEAPHRLRESLAGAAEVLGPRRACVARELTKLHEEVLRGTLPGAFRRDRGARDRTRRGHRRRRRSARRGRRPSAPDEVDALIREALAGGAALKGLSREHRPALGPAGARDLRPRPGALEAVSEPIVRVSRLTKVFKSFRREEGLAAALKSLVKRTRRSSPRSRTSRSRSRRARWSGYIGANGAGKSTTIKMLTGILTPDLGRDPVQRLRAPPRAHALRGHDRRRLRAAHAALVGHRRRRVLPAPEGDLRTDRGAVPRAHGPLRQGARPQGLPPASPSASSRSASACAATSPPRSSTGRRCSSSTSPRSASTWSPRPTCGSSSRRSTGATAPPSC